MVIIDSQFVLKDNPIKNNNKLNTIQTNKNIKSKLTQSRRFSIMPN